MADADSAPVQMIPCTRCSGATTVAEMNRLGARCPGCFEAYCAEPPRWPVVPGGMRGGPRGWAHDLKAREDAGQQIGPVQRAAWREALGRGALVPLPGEQSLPTAALGPSRQDLRAAAALIDEGPVVLPPAIPIPPRRRTGTDAEYESMPPGELL